MYNGTIIHKEVELMSNMFCFQCEQTAKGTGCTVSGACGKKPSTSNLQDELTGALIGLTKAQRQGEETTQSTYKTIIEGLFVTITNVAFDDDAIRLQIEKTKMQAAESTGDKLENISFEAMDMQDLWTADEDSRSLKSLILLGMRGMAAYAYHALMLDYIDDEVNAFFLKGLRAISENLSADELLNITMELGQVNLKCMELLDKANTESYGTPVPTKVSTNLDKGPFIVVSGHDLKDLETILKQTQGKGVDIYTHGEMLPAHSYPKLKAYSHLKGNFGTAWQNQQKELHDLKGAVLFTTNCLMPVKESYKDRVFTTEVVSYPELVHIDDNKDFTPVIEKALELGGYPEGRKMTGINGGDVLTTGFGWGTVLSVADKVIDAVKTGAIKHFFVVGGCDGAKPGRNYYTELVEKSPKDSVILTLACGKYRFNDLDLGEIGGLPRIMDMGQCNDTYSAIRVALALAEAFDCTVNELPLSIILSWYEQKAVCVLLTLLSLGITNIRLGPTLPAFVSPNVLNILVDKFGLAPITTAEEDLKTLLA